MVLLSVGINTQQLRGVGALQKGGRLSLSRCSARALQSQLSKTSPYKDGVQREKEKPKSKHGFCRDWALGTIGTGGSQGAAGVCELPFAGPKKHPRGDVFFEK